MKFARFGLVVVVMMVCASPLFVRSSYADDDAAKTTTAAPATKTAPSSAKHADMAKSPEDMAKQATAKWKDTLKLTDEQTPKFQAAMEDSYKKMADAKTAAAGDKTKMKASAEQIMKDRHDAMATILTPDQMKTYDAKMAAMSSKAKEHMAKASTEGSAK